MGCKGGSARERDEDRRIKDDGLRGRRGKKDGRSKESMLGHSVEMGTKESYLLVARNCEEGGDRIQLMNDHWSSRRGGGGHDMGVNRTYRKKSYSHTCERSDLNRTNGQKSSVEVTFLLRKLAEGFTV